MSPTPTITKARKTRPVSAETPDPLEAVQTVVAIPLDKLHRHPDNRTITPESVAELVESLTEHGQREALRVRPLADPIGHYEILSGERRFVAAGQIPGIESLRCIVETHSSVQAQIELAIANAARKDLNPIERGELLTVLITPESEGGAGMDRAAAGRVFGLNSESGVKNALRLVKLPKFFRDLLAAGKISVAKARPLCAYPDSLLVEFAAWLQSSKEKYRLSHFLEPVTEDEEADGDILSFVRRETRPCDKWATADCGYQIGYDVPWLGGELTDELRIKLDVVEIPFKPKGYERAKGKLPPTRLVALDCKEWERINVPLYKASIAKNAKNSKAKSEKTSGEKSKPTPAELKARRKKADDTLKAFTVEWQREALRCAIANAGQPYNAVMFWLLSQYDGDRFRAPKLKDVFEWAVVEGGLSAHDCRAKRIAATGPTSELIWAAYQLLLWPVASHDKSHGDLTSPGVLPDELPPLDGTVVDELAEVVGVSMETIWRDARAAFDFSAPTNLLRELVRKWIGRHTKDQLVDLASSLGVTLADGRRDDMVDELLNMHTTKAKGLKMPAAFASPSKVGGRRK